MQSAESLARKVPSNFWTGEPITRLRDLVLPMPTGEKLAWEERTSFVGGAGGGVAVPYTTMCWRVLEESQAA